MGGIGGGCLAGPKRLNGIVMKQIPGNYPIEILMRHKATLETNIKGVPGMVINDDTITIYRKQLRQLKKAIAYLELFETRRPGGFGF